MWQHIPVRGNVLTDAREHSYKPVQMMYSAMVYSPTERFRNMTSLCTCPKSCLTVLHIPWYPSSLASVYEIMSLYHISPIYKERESLITQTQSFIFATEFLVNGKVFLEIQDLSSLLQLRHTEFTYSVDKSTTRGPSTSCNLLCFSEKVSHRAQASV